MVRFSESERSYRSPGPGRPHPGGSLSVMIFQYIDNKLKVDERIYQGQISFGAHAQSTYLGSCVSIIALSNRGNFGGLSHVVGHRTSIGDHNLAHQVLDVFQEREKTSGPYSYFVIGGSERCRHVLDEVDAELGKRRIRHIKLDILGLYFREVYFFPRSRTIKLRKVRACPNALTTTGGGSRTPALTGSIVCGATGSQIERVRSSR